MSNIHIRIAEYIELLNNGYIPKSNDILTKFSDGSSINRFWTTNKDKIIYTLNNDLRYQIGYEQAKAAINKNTVRHKLQEFIELLNNGYIPTKLDYQTKFKNGESINFFWPNHKDKVINALNNDPNYQIGYEKAKEIISQLATKTSIEIKLSRRINEYIELLNHGYIPNSNENKVKFQNGDLINQFWQNQKERIITTLNNDPKYEVGYETAKDIINQLATKAPKEIKLSRQITEYIELINTGYIPKTQDNSISFSSGELLAKS